jgi:hypothetical protein
MPPSPTSDRRIGLFTDRSIEMTVSLAVEELDSPVRQSTA